MYMVKQFYETVENEIEVKMNTWMAYEQQKPSSPRQFNIISISYTSSPHGDYVYLSALVLYEPAK